MNTKKILLVDDSSTALMANRMIISKGPYQVVTARDGQEAVERAEAEKPDAIVMDVMMPRMNGFEATRRMRELDATRSTPIILVTTRSELENVENGFVSGCTDYVTKPVNAMELMAKLRSHLGEG